MNELISWFNAAVTFGTIILFGCLGEILNEKSGGLNLGVPGIMMLGGIGAIIGAFLYENSGLPFQGWLAFLVPLFSCLIFSLFAGLVYAFLTVSLKANQNVTGLILTTFGSGIADFIGGILMKLSGGAGQISLKATSALYRARIPFLSSALGPLSSIFFNYGFLVYLSILLAFLLHYFLNKSRAGLNLRAVGENPATADASGISVKKNKYFAALIGALISGLGGLYFVMDYVMGTWNSDSALEALGWLALALVIFSSWKPLKAIFGAYLFGLCFWVYLYMPSFISRFLAAVLHVENVAYLKNLYKGIPYLVTIIILCFVSAREKKENRAPGSLGINYFREER